MAMISVLVDDKAVLAEILRMERMLAQPEKALYSWGKRVQGASRANTRKRGNKKYWRQIARSLVIQGWGDVRFVRAYNPAAGRMQYGGVIKPRSGKFLAVPIKSSMGGDGKGNKNLSRLRGDKNVFTVKTPKGNIIIARRDKRSKKRLIPLFVLKRKVLQRAHPFIISRGEIMKFGIAAFQARIASEARRNVS